MAKSRRFRQLRSELKRLWQHFLPSVWDKTGTYNERKIDRARAFRILAHAEIEYYIENLLLDAVEKSYNAWKTSKKPSYVMTCLVAASKVGWHDAETDEQDLSPITPPKIRDQDDSINELIERAAEQYRTMVKENNGIKTRDLKRLLMPLGIALSDLDQTWRNNMDSFGGRRGFVAHTSRLGVSTPLDPKTEKETVDKLLLGLEELDKLVAAL